MVIDFLTSLKTALRLVVRVLSYLGAGGQQGVICRAYAVAVP